jgi:hypothetical protein
MEASHFMASCWISSNVHWTTDEPINPGYCGGGQLRQHCICNFLVFEKVHLQTTVTGLLELHNGKLPTTAKCVTRGTLSFCLFHWLSGYW